MTSVVNATLTVFFGKNASSTVFVIIHLQARRHHLQCFYQSIFLKFMVTTLKHGYLFYI